MTSPTGSDALLLPDIPQTKGPEYDDLVLVVESSHGGHRVTAVAANRSATGSLALSAEGIARQTLLGATAADSRGEIRRVGEDLHSALFADSAVRELLNSAREAAATSDRGLRLLLDLDSAPALIGLPWELLRDDQGFLGLSGWTPIVRVTAAATPQRDAPVAAPLQILGMVSAPAGAGYDPIDSVEERERVEAMLSPLLTASFGEIRWTADGTLASLREEVAAGRVTHVFHFIGHGSFDEATGGGMVFEGEDGEPQVVSPEDLGVVLGEARSLRLAVLNACGSARIARADRLSSVAGTIAARGAAAVVAMQAAISDRAAVDFAGELYRMIAVNASVEAAVAEGRRAIFPSGTSEWALPTLTMSARDGRLFQIKGDTATLRRLRPRFDVAALRRSDEAGDAESAFRLATILGEQGKHAEERAALERADRRGHGRAALVLATLHAAERQDAQALTAYRRAADAGEADGAFNLAHMLKDRGDFAGAERALWQAIELGSVEAAANLGNMRERQGDVEGAERAFRIGAKRDDPAALNNLGRLLTSRPDRAAREEARVCFARATDLGSREAASNLGSILYAEGDHEHGQRLWEVADERGDAVAAYNLFVLHTEREEPEPAFLALRRAAMRGHPQAQQLASAWERSRGR